jgi:DNA repair protein RecN (Recombination protein N)
MLRKLFIRDIVLIDQLSIGFEPGLNVLTGETGAGKSILLDALALALGERGDAGRVRRGVSEGSVTAAFEVPADHPAPALLQANGLHLEPGEALILRRLVGADGRTKAFINDQPVGVALLREVGDTLVEIHGQHDDRGLLNPKGHRALLDAFAGNETTLETARRTHAAWKEAGAELAEFQAGLARERASEDYDRHCFDEIAALDPKAGEEETLAEERRLMLEGQKAAGQLDEVRQILETDEPLDARLRSAVRRLERLPESLRSHLAGALAALDRAANEAAEGAHQLGKACQQIAFDPERLEAAEERLFALKGLARKHKCQVAELPALARALAEKLSALDHGEGRAKELEGKAVAAKTAFLNAAKELGARRQKAAGLLDRGVAKELGPLRLGRAKFKTAILPLEDTNVGPEGAERVEFQVATTPGAPLGPLLRIASGGELSRFILALKVVLAKDGAAPCLIFDEVDRGIGGAVADAVGERLTGLARGAQVLVVTHSPQVAARAGHHFRVTKIEGDTTARILVTALASGERREEIARMLSGAQVTDKARAAAESLIAGAS